MIPILYEKDETAFISNGLGRLRDCISCVVFEERNGLYECDFEISMDSEDFPLIQIGRIIGVTHDDTDDIQPFDIVSYERPIEGVVKFHAVHISYRQSYLTVNGTNINSLADAFTLFGTATPTNPFTYETDKTSTGYLGCADGLPKTVRSMLGGIEGSVLDAYGGEYEWDKFRVILHSARGQYRDFAIRYGVNMVDYNEEVDMSGTYSSVIPYWTDGTDKVVGDKQDSGSSTVTGRGECVPLDVSDKFDSDQGKPTKAQVEAMGASVLNSKTPYLPVQNIHVEFIRLQDLPEYAGFGNLMRCQLCDTIKVIFPDYNSSGQFKIVKTTWNVLTDRYDSMELGDLSMSLSEALGIDNSSSHSGGSENTALVGEMRAYAGTVAPEGWLICDGRAISRTDYAALFALIGTTFGSGDGSSTFNIPDTRGRTLLGVGNGTATGHTNHTLGQKAGNENAIIPYHRHERGGNYASSSSSGSTRVYVATANQKAPSASYTEYAGTSGNTTGANMMPYLGINYIIYTGKVS